MPSCSDRYRGPRIPLRLHAKGQYVLQVPGTSTVIDGACENSPFKLSPFELSPAIYANHSSWPNACIQTWPVLQPRQYEIRQHVVLVATEAIDAGQEIRIDYEAGGSKYWLEEQPVEGDRWRDSRVPSPRCIADEPVYDQLQELQEAAAARRVAAIPTALQQSNDPLVWAGSTGGDARLRLLVPMFSVNGRDANQSAWPLVSTHIPGRSGRECRERWMWLTSAEMVPVGDVGSITYRV